MIRVTQIHADGDHSIWELPNGEITCAFPNKEMAAYWYGIKWLHSRRFWFIPVGGTLVIEAI